MRKLDDVFSEQADWDIEIRERIAVLPSSRCNLKLRGAAAVLVATSCFTVS